jgi:hypothetical protein
MNKAFSLSQAFNDAGVALEARDQVTSVAAARRVAYSLPLPQEPVGSPIDFYNENYFAQAEEAIAGMNEKCVLDFDFCAAVSRLYWLARYKVLHEPDSSEALTAVTGIVNELLNREFTEDLGFVQDPHDTGGGTGSRVAVINGRTTLVGGLSALAASAESLKPTFSTLWGNDTKGG